MPDPDILARPWVYHRGAVYEAGPRDGNGNPCVRIAVRCPDEAQIPPADFDRALRACAALPALLKAVRRAIPVLWESCATTDAEDPSDRLALDACEEALRLAGLPA